MNTKKLIGTIIGVIMFVALIAGATFAWLTFNASIENGIYNQSSENFVIEYEGGTAITSMLDVVSSPNVNNVTKIIKVSAYRKNDSSTGTLNIKLNSSSTGTFTTGGVIKYAVCSGTSTTSNCTGALTTNSNGVLSASSVNDTGNITLYTTAIPSTQTYYWIYFWADAQKITDAHVGQEYSGYVYADATQN